MVLQTLLEAVCRAGARLAEPGEFTMRAFFNGRMDLTRVEAVSDIVNAGSALGLQVSANQLRGRLYEAILALKEDVAHVAALVAAGIDFPEEDVVFSHRDDIVGRLQGVAGTLGEMVARAGQGRLLREGLAVAIVGRPNVGKSSLLNALLRENRAIVTEIPGTTRDTLEETAQFGGLLLRLIDTAGIRATEDPVEREGVRRSEKAMAQADLVLLLLDGSAPLAEEDRRLLQESPEARTLLVVNKRDRMTGDAPAWVDDVRNRTWVAISALTGDGLDAMEQQVRRLAFAEERPQLEHVLITNLRQQQAAQQALAAVEQALRGVDEQVGDELLAIDVGRALDALGDIVGETTADDLLNRIFAEFCIGK
jgi:tRNA modification GTPase